MTSEISTLLSDIKPDQPVLIAGPTASGKSALALHIAEQQGGVIVNADALQVFDCWQLLSARPDDADLARAPHALYGHVSYLDSYSTGQWLRDLEPLLTGARRPIIVGGTGLNFTALTEGLAEIPPITQDVRQLSDAMSTMERLQDLVCRDPKTAARIDLDNPARVQRAWEVLQVTGRPLADWQDATPPPRLKRKDCTTIVLDAPKAWLSPRIETRFDLMLKKGALEEVRALSDDWNPDRPSARAIGARELMDYLKGHCELEAARNAAIIASRQYAKRQRTWFASRMSDWTRIQAAAL
ncbi:MAG: tRNA (adenosine(37)-N6)-dimethylallyltransferase MiaA [Pseudomonadota bacterium]